MVTRYGVNWLRVWLGGVGCITPFVLAALDLTGSVWRPFPLFPPFLVMQMVCLASTVAHGKYRTVREELRQLDHDDKRAKLLQQRRRSLAYQRKRSELREVALIYVVAVGLSLIGVVVAYRSQWIETGTLTKALLYAFGVPGVSVGSLSVEMREMENSDVNRELDRLIALEDLAAVKQQEQAAITQVVPAAALITEKEVETSLVLHR